MKEFIVITFAEDHSQTGYASYRHLTGDQKGIWRKNGLHLSSASIIFKDI